jgi:DNA polymerase III delta subunit
MLAWQLRQAAQARALLDDGLSSRDIGKRLRLFGYRLDPVIKAARKRPLKYHTKRLSLLADLDEALKSFGGTPVTSWLQLERTILRLCPHGTHV